MSFIVNSFSPKELISETFDKFSSLSNVHKSLCIALTILGTLCFIVPGILLFHFSIVKFHDWENTSEAKQTANKVDSTFNPNRNNNTQVQPNIPKLESQNSASSATVPIVKKKCYHQKKYLKSFINDFSDNNALNDLIKRGSPGDYILLKGKASNGISVAYINEQKSIAYFELFEHEESNFYECFRARSSLRNLNNLKRPLHPGLSEEKSAQIQGALNDYKYLCLIQALSGAVKSETISSEFAGIDAPFDLYGLLEWLEECPEVPTRDCLVSSIFPFFSKAYGHIFGLNGEIKINNEKIKLEGMFSLHATSLVGTCQKEHLQATQLFSKEEKDRFDDFISRNCSYFSYEKSSPEKEIHRDILQGKIVSFSSGWKGHAINITLSKNIIAVTNRGDRIPGMAAGTYMYTIKDIDRFTPEKIARYFSQSHQKDDLIFKQLVEDSVSDILDPLFFHKSTDQRVGNCSFINNITSSFVTAFFYKYEENHNMQEAIDFGKRFYREARVHNKTMALDFWKRLQRIIPENKKVEHFDIFQSFNRLLFEKCEEKKQVSKNRNKDPKEYELLYRHAHEMMSQCSLSLDEILPNLNYIGQRGYSQYPQGTFGFSKTNQWAYYHSVGISLKDDPFELVAITLQKQLGGFYKADILIKFDGPSSESFKFTFNLTTVGDLVNKVKEASLDAASKKGNIDYKGLELKFVV